MLTRIRIMVVACGLLVALGASASRESASTVDGAPTEVFVLATLYARHARVPAYDLAVLRRVVRAIAPEVLVVDCTPEEVASRRVSPGKIEYPGVIFPLVQEGGQPMYPAEPGEPRFTEIVQRVSAVRTQIAQEQPSRAQAFEAFETSTYAWLAQHWQSPAAVHDEVTEVVMRGVGRVEREVYGRWDGEAQVAWNRHWTEAIQRAVVKHPGRRVLAVTGVENRPWIVEALRQDARVRLVDMEAWLRVHVP